RTGNRGAEVVEQSAGGCRWWRQVSAQRREGLPHPAAENVAEVAQLTLDLLDVRHLAGTEEIEVLQRVQLAGNDPAVVVVLVHLCRGWTEDVVGGAAVADHALGAAGIVPRLLALAARCLRVPDREASIRAARLDQHRIGLRLVPAIGVSRPFALLSG